MTLIIISQRILRSGGFLVRKDLKVEQLLIQFIAYDTYWGLSVVVVIIMYIFTQEVQKLFRVFPIVVTVAPTRNL